MSRIVRDYFDCFHLVRWCQDEQRFIKIIDGDNIGDDDKWSGNAANVDADVSLLSPSACASPSII